MPLHPPLPMLVSESNLKCKLHCPQGTQRLTKWKKSAKEKLIFVTEVNVTDVRKTLVEDVPVTFHQIEETYGLNVLV